MTTDVQVVVADDPNAGMDEYDPKNSPATAFRAECKKTKRLIMMKLVYIRYVADVDTLNETFKCAFGLDMIWKATEEDKKNYAADPATFTPGWVPNFEFPNAKEIELERRVLVTGNPFKVTPEGNNFLRTLCTGVFMTKFDLHAFPFDVQDLHIIMDMSFDLKEEALLVPWNESWSTDPAGPAPSAEKNFVQLNRAFSAIPDFEARRVIIEFACRENCWGQMTLRIQMARRPHGMLGRVASLCCLLGVSTLSTFAMDPISDLASRISFCITNVLAFTAFCFIISAQLPMTPYLTLMDRYNLASFVYLVCVMCVIAILARSPFADENARRQADNVLFFVSAGALLLIQGYFIYESWWLRHKELAKLRMGLQQLQSIDNVSEDESPINVYGAGFLPERFRKGKKADPFVSFEGKASLAYSSHWTAPAKKKA